MKRYKFLVPIVLVVLFGLSVYKLSADRAAKQREYDGLLSSARQNRQLGVVVDANREYQAALELRPSAELALELGGMYLENDLQDTAVAWGEELITQYPKDVRVYEYLMDLYREKAYYGDCFELYEKAAGRKLSSERLEEIYRAIQYTFTLGVASYRDVGIYSGTLIPVQIGELWGYANKTGKLVIDARFTQAGAYLSELAPVAEQDGSTYFIDGEGNKKHVVQNVENVRQLGIVSGTTYSAFNGNTWDFYSLENDVRLFGGYEDASGLGNGVAAVKQDGKWGLVSSSGETLVQPRYDEVVQDEKTVVCRNERLFVREGGSYRMIDAAGNPIGSQSYEAAHIFGDATYAAVKQGGKWGFVDRDGTMVIAPQYEDARSFSNGLAAVKQGGKWGFVAPDNGIAIEPQFDDARDFNSAGSTFVKIGEEWQCLSLYRDNH